MEGLDLIAKAETYVEEQRPGWLHLRLRCTADNKVVFSDQAGAQRAANKITDHGRPMKAYLGKCGHWHLAKRTRRNP